MFFEPLPAGEPAFAAPLPESPPWSGPPALETGAVLAVNQTVARSAMLVLRLPTIRAFRSGCMLDMEVVSRKDGLCGRMSSLRRFGLWLWPSPPAEAFEFAVEWPLGGIELTIAELDGAAVAAAATRSAYYWPETEQATEAGRGDAAHGRN